MAPLRMPAENSNWPDMRLELWRAVLPLVSLRFGRRKKIIRRGHTLSNLALKTLCPSGLRGWTQVPLARAAWVQIPQVSILQQQLRSAAKNPSFVASTFWAASTTKARN